MTIQPLGHAFQRGDRQHRLERHRHIDAFARRQNRAAPDRAASVPSHGRAGSRRHGALRRAASRRNGSKPIAAQDRWRIVAGKPPAPGLRCCQRIGRRADAELARDRALLVPGIESVGLHANGDVEIEPDLQAKSGRRDRLAALRVAGRHSIARIRRIRFRLASAPKRRLARALRILRLRAIPPAIPTTARFLNLPAQHLEAGEMRDSNGAAARCGIFRSPAFRSGVSLPTLKAGEGRTQAPAISIRPPRRSRPHRSARSRGVNSADIWSRRPRLNSGSLPRCRYRAR